MRDMCVCSMGARVLSTDALALYQPLTGERRERHELAHVRQAAERCPRWLRWLPGLRVRAWFGWPKFFGEYVTKHAINGYSRNPLELEARDAEEPTLVQRLPGPPAAPVAP